MAKVYREPVRLESVDATTCAFAMSFAFSDESTEAPCHALAIRLSSRTLPDIRTHPTQMTCAAGGTYWLCVCSGTVCIWRWHGKGLFAAIGPGHQRAR